MANHYYSHNPMTLAARQREWEIALTLDQRDADAEIAHEIACERAYYARAEHDQEAQDQMYADDMRLGWPF